MSAPSIITIMPLLCDLHVSDCHVGTVDVFIPFPMPVMILPMMKWSRPKAEVCRAAPTTMMAEPRKIVLRRPSMSPIQMHMIAPRKHPISALTSIPNQNQSREILQVVPTLYEATAMPWIVETWSRSSGAAPNTSISGNVLTKEPKVNRPPMTPFANQRMSIEKARVWQTLIISKQQEIETCNNTNCIIQLGALEAEIATSPKHLAQRVRNKTWGISKFKSQKQRRTPAAAKTLKNKEKEK